MPRFFGRYCLLDLPTYIGISVFAFTSLYLINVIIPIIISISRTSSLQFFRSVIVHRWLPTMDLVTCCVIVLHFSFLFEIGLSYVRPMMGSLEWIEECSQYDTLFYQVLTIFLNTASVLILCGAIGLLNMFFFFGIIYDWLNRNLIAYGKRRALIEQQIEQKTAILAIYQSLAKHHSKSVSFSQHPISIIAHYLADDIFGETVNATLTSCEIHRLCSAYIKA